MGLRWERLCSAVPGFVRALRVSQRRFGAPYSYPVGTTQSIPAGYPDGSKCPLSDRNPDIRTPSSPRPDPAESCHSCSISLNDGYGAQADVRRQSPRRAVLGGKQSLNVGFMVRSAPSRPNNEKPQRGMMMPGLLAGRRGGLRPSPHGLVPLSSNRWRPCVL